MGLTCCLGVCSGAHQLHDWYELELGDVRTKMKAIIAGITVMLNFIDGNPALPLVGDLNINPLPPDPFVERCRGALVNFRAYVHGIVGTTTGHALAVVQFLYPVVSLEVIDTGFATRTEGDDAEQLAMEAMELAFRLIEDLDIFDDEEQNNEEN